MEVHVTICVRNPGWYNKSIEPAYREAFEMINEGKIDPHTPSVTFRIAGNVVQYRRSSDDSYLMKFLPEDEKAGQSPSFTELVLEGVDATEFIGADGKSVWVVVSSSLIHHQIDAQNAGGIKRYWYYYLKEDVEYVMLSSNIWLSMEHMEAIHQQVPGFDIGAHFRGQQ